MRNKVKLTIAAFIGCILVMYSGISVSAAGALTVAVSSGTVVAGEKVTITAYAAGANNEEVTADMTITYDSSKLEYVSSTGKNASGGGGTVKSTGSAVNVEFKAISSGDAYVKVESPTLTAAGTHIIVSGSNNSGSAQTTENTTTNTTANTTLSGDNSLSSLTISPGSLSPAFKGSTTQYTAEVGSDVAEIQVTPVTSNRKATIVSITGNTGLKVGENIITVLVKAENGTEASYKITVNKKESGSTTEPTVETTAEITEEPVTSDNTDISASRTGDNILIDGVKYHISEEFTEEQIPTDFTRTDFEYKGAPYQGVIFDHGHLGMYYLVNEAGEGKFFIYDADRDKFYPFVRLDSGEHYIVLMVVPNGAIPPEDYEETTLTIEDTIVITAYQFAGEVDEEIISFETENGSGTSDFYIFYGMDATGVSGWYQYDIKQGTYQRLNEEYRNTSSGGEDYDALLASHEELNKRYKETKAKDRRLIAGLIFTSVILVIIIVNLVIKIREKNDDDDDDNDQYDEYDEIEEKLERISRKNTRKVQEQKNIEKTKVEARPQMEPVNKSDDEFNIEFIDLNDL